MPISAGGQVAEALGRIALGVGVSGALVWSALAIRYWNRGSAVVRKLLSWGWALLWLAWIAGSGSAHTSLIAFGAAFAVLALAWAGIRARGDLAWEPWYGRQATGELQGAARLVLRDVRNFRWSTRTAALESWERREYDLDDLRGVDLVTSSWGVRGVVHTLLSFRFGEADYLSLSIETRLERGEGQNPLHGMFKRYELIYIFADERDVLALRTNVRLEETRIYPTTLDAERARALLLAAVEDANGLAVRPRFYNTLWRNCLTSVLPALNAQHPVALDLSLVLNAGFDAHVLQSGLIETNLDIDAARERFGADEPGRSSRDLANYSRRVRPWRYANLPSTPGSDAAVEFAAS